MDDSLRAVRTVEGHVASILADLQRMGAQPELRSRELSLAITNIEQGAHWLDALDARLLEGPAERSGPPVPKSPAG